MVLLLLLSRKGVIPLAIRLLLRHRMRAVPPRVERISPIHRITASAFPRLPILLLPPRITVLQGCQVSLLSLPCQEEEEEGEGEACRRTMQEGC